MDTPERTQIGSSSTPISKYEDSPVFNYINNLSPIKPVKSIHVTQAFSSLTFSSLPSIFTSPQVTSIKESWFLRRHQNLESSKLKSLSADVETMSNNEGTQDEADLQEISQAGISIASASVEQPGERAEFAIELPRTLKYDCGSPDCCTNQDIDLQRVDAIDRPEGNANHGDNQTGKGCDWEGLVVSDTPDLLILSSPNDAEAFRGIFQNSPGLAIGLGVSPSSSFFQNNMTNVQQMQLFFQVGLDKEPEMGDASQNLEIRNTQEDHGSDDLESVEIYSTDGLENESAALESLDKMKALSNLQRGMRRRCLDFEMVGGHKCKILCDSSSSHSENKINSKNLQLPPVNNNRRSRSSRCIVPGIGLHLNSLALAKRDYKVIKCDTLSSETQVLNASDQELLPQTMISSAPEKEADESGDILVEDTSQALVLMNPEELNPSSPRKKRHKVEHGVEGEACKRCNCKKSKCLKLYCECFAAGVYCTEPCACQDCFNKPIHEDIVLATRKHIESRNPLAFAPKVIRCSDTVDVADESMKTPASARHKRGCNCKKSSCLKKYCECYQSGVGCSVNCRCEGCKNAFGTKDGSILVGPECAAEEEEAEKSEKTEHDAITLKRENSRMEEQVPSANLPSTPSGLSRPLAHLVFPLSKVNPPRTSFLTKNGSSIVLKGSQKLRKDEFLLPPQPKLEKLLQPKNAEDEMPEILRGSSTPNDGIKMASPNCKRVSPPHGELGSSPSLRSGRRLILQSIPSFPSLT
ncbi:hypothetical protein SAY86_027639 [Trapa natans]|uniref:CRC domain-containing protein n=1 Tax=Trapa natans TaxID=22666 RepID=A0AAN7QJE3_TRANT|nr:hypothetical protein SAY86_027639 [Trapa natans]